MLNCHLPMFLTNSFKNCKLIGGVFLFLLHPIFIYECVTNINHTPFERGENFLSTDNKIYLSEPVYQRDIGIDIFRYRFLKEMRSFFEGASISYCVISFMDM